MKTMETIAEIPTPVIFAVGVAAIGLGLTAAAAIHDAIAAALERIRR